MRVLYHISYYKPAYIYGGPVISTSNLCEGLAALGVQVTVMTTNANGQQRLAVPLETPVEVNGVEVIYCPLGFTGRYFYSPRLVEVFRKVVSQYDLIVTDSFLTYLLGGTASAALAAQKPYIIPIRGQLFPWALKQSAIKKQIYMRFSGRRWLNQAAGLHCTTPEEETAVQQLGLTAPTFTVPNSIDTQAFAELTPSDRVRQQYGIPPTCMLLVQVGRLVAIKRPDISVKVLAELPHTHLILAGPCEPAFEEQLKSYARNWGCLDRLHFTGLLDNEGIKPILASADLLLMPSEVQENFGTAAAEALAAGIPVLTSTGIPIGRRAMEEQAGFATECTPEHFVDAARKLCADPEGLKQMGKRARHFMQQFEKKAVAQRMLSHYERIIELQRRKPQ